PAASRRASDIEATVPERPYWRRKEGMNGLLRFMKDCGATVAVEVDTPPFLSDVPRYKLFRIFSKGNQAEHVEIRIGQHSGPVPSMSRDGAGAGAEGGAARPGRDAALLRAAGQ